MRDKPSNAVILYYNFYFTFLNASACWRMPTSAANHSLLRLRNPTAVANDQNIRVHRNGSRKRSPEFSWSNRQESVVLVPFVPSVKPICVTKISAPALAIFSACSSSNTYGVVNIPNCTIPGPSVCPLRQPELSEPARREEVLQQRPARLPAFLLFIIVFVILLIGSLQVWGIRLGFLRFLLLLESGQDRIRQLLSDPCLAQLFDRCFPNLLQ